MTDLDFFSLEATKKRIDDRKWKGLFKRRRNMMRKLIAQREKKVEA